MVDPIPVRPFDFDPGRYSHGSPGQEPSRRRKKDRDADQPEENEEQANSNPAPPTDADVGRQVDLEA